MKTLLKSADKIYIKQYINYLFKDKYPCIGKKEWLNKYINNILFNIYQCDNNEYALYFKENLYIFDNLMQFITNYINAFFEYIKTISLCKLCLGEYNINQNIINSNLKFNKIYNKTLNSYVYELNNVKIYKIDINYLINNTL